MLSSQCLNSKGKTLLVVIKKLSVFSSAPKQSMIFEFSQWPSEGKQKSINFFKIAIERSDSAQHRRGCTQNIFSFYPVKYFMALLDLFIYFRYCKNDRKKKIASGNNLALVGEEN